MPYISETELSNLQQKINYLDYDISLLLEALKTIAKTIDGPIGWQSNCAKIAIAKIVLRKRDK